MELLTQEYNSAHSDKAKISVAAKILSQRNQKGKKELITLILDDKSSKVRKILFKPEYSSWDNWGITYDEYTVLLLRTIVFDPDEEIRKRAYFEVDPVFFHNGSDGCSRFNVIKVNVNKSNSMTESEKKEVINYLDTTIQDGCNGKW